MSALKYWLWLSTRKGLTNRAMLRLLERFGTPEAAYFTPTKMLQDMNMPPREYAALADKSLDIVDEIFGDCQRLGVRIITRQDADYPQRLAEIADPPIVLYLKGHLPILDECVTIAVVGTRSPSVYGIKMADRLGRELAQSGTVVVSGIAQGLDTAAIKGALRAGGTVVSVVGNGVDVPYPRQNVELYKDIAVTGAVLSEYPPGTQPRGSHFPVRNRIISGLSLGVVVVEGGLRSGTMITAHQALDQGRDTFAVPGPVDVHNSTGPNSLIRQGEAKLVTCALDILEEYEAQFPHRLDLERLSKGEDFSDQANVVEESVAATAGNSPTQPQRQPKRPPQAQTVPYSQQEHGALSEVERKILETVVSPVGIEEIALTCGMTNEEISSQIILLEMRGLVREVPVRRYQAKVAL